MATITVRNLDDDVQQRIRERAARHHRSMEAEARAILTAAVEQPSLAAAWVEMASTTGPADIELPPRSAAGDVVEL